jgi:hypothetical protein
MTFLVGASYFIGSAGENPDYDRFGSMILADSQHSDENHVAMLGSAHKRRRNVGIAAKGLTFVMMAARADKTESFRMLDQDAFIQGCTFAESKQSLAVFLDQAFLQQGIEDIFTFLFTGSFQDERAVDFGERYRTVGGMEESEQSVLPFVGGEPLSSLVGIGFGAVLSRFFERFSFLGHVVFFVFSGRGILLSCKRILLFCEITADRSEWNFLQVCLL